MSRDKAISTGNILPADSQIGTSSPNQTGPIDDHNEILLQCEKLKCENEFFQRVIESLPCPFVVLDAKDFSVKLANSVAVSGAYPETKEYLDQQMETNPLRPAEIVRQSKVQELTEYSHRDKDGQVRDIQIHAIPVLDGNGDVTEVIEYHLDVTDLRRDEKSQTISHQPLRTMIDNSGEAIVVTQDGRFQYINPKLVELSGYTNAELMSKPFTEFVHPDDRELVREYHRKRLNNESVPPLYQFRIINKEGQIIWLENSGVLISWEKRPAAINFLSNITNRRQAEERFRHRLDMEKAVAQSSALLLSSQKADFDMILRICGEAAGANRSCILRMDDNSETSLTCTHEWCDAHTLPGIGIHQHVNLNFLCGWKDLMLGGESMIIPNVDAMTEEAADFRQILQKENIRAILVVPIMSAAGNLVGMIGFDDTQSSRQWLGEDVEALKTIANMISNYWKRQQTEEAIQKIRLQQAAILDNIPDIAWLKDQESRYIAANKPFAESCGVDQNDLIGKTDYDLWPPELARKYIQDDMEVMRLGLRKQVEEFLTDKNGRTFWIDTVKTPIYNEKREVIGTTGIARDIAQRKQAEEALRRSETKYRTLYDMTNDAAMLADQTGFLDCNKAALSIFGCATREEFCSKHPADLSPPLQPCGTDSLTLANQRIAIAMEKGSIHFEWMHKRVDTGEIFPADVLLSAMELDGRPVVQGVVRDMSERKAVEKKLARLNRVYAMLSDVDQTIVRVKDKQKLFEETCRVAIQHGSFKLAWVGVLDSRTGKVRSVAKAGSPDGYPINASVLVDDALESWEQMSSTFQTGTPLFCNDIEREHRLSAWREEALKRGFRSSASFPFTISSEVVGALNLYASEPDVFNDQEIALLNELTSDISFALQSLEQEEKRKQAEEAVGKLEENYRVVVENANEAIIITQEDRIIYSNPKSFELSGYSKEELSSISFINFIHPDDAEELLKDYQQTIKNKEHSRRMSFRIIRKDGTIRWLEANAAVLERDGNVIVLDFLNDITERKLADEEIRKERDKAQMYLDTAGTIFVALDTNQTITMINKKGCDILGYGENQLIGKNWFDFCLPERIREAARTNHGRLLSGNVGKNSYYEYPIRGGNAQERIIAWYNTLIRAESGNIIGTLSSGADITERKLLEEQLQGQKELLASVISNIPLYVYWKDDESRYIGCNDVFAKAAGLASTLEIIGKTDYDLPWMKEEADDYINNDKEVIRKKISQVNRVESRHQADNAEVTLLASRVPLLNTDGQVISILGIEADITDRQKAEDRLERSLATMRATLESTTDGILVTGLADEVVDYNQRFVDLWSVPNSVLATASANQLLDFISDQLVDANKFRDDLRNMGGASAIRHDDLLRLKNGKTLECSSLPQILGGQSIGQVWSFHDITIRKNAEETISRTVRQYTAMIDTVPALMFAKDIDLRYIVANDMFCKSAGKTRDQIIGKTDFDLYPQERAKKHREIDRLIMQENHAIINKEEQSVDEKGEAQWTTSTMASLRNNRGEVVGIVGLIQDITEQRRGRERLVQSDKLAAIGTLAAGVAHEINNPMGYISSNLNTMKKYIGQIQSYFDSSGIQKDDKYQSIHDIIEDFGDAINESVDGSSRVKKIVADLKSFSRVDRAEKDHADINEGLRSTMNIVWNELKYHCKVETEYGNLPDLFCIPNQLNQVFMNILLNAGQAIKTKTGLIKVKTWADDKHIYVSIKDNGAGIAEEHMKKIFEPFFTTKEVGKGTGLGLSLAYDIIKKHNGRIDVKSKVGVGTEFIITLPQEGLNECQTDNSGG